MGVTPTTGRAISPSLSRCAKIGADFKIKEFPVSRSDNESMDFASGMAAFEAKHFSRAIQLLSPFASQGDKVAQHLCAIMHQNGLGIMRNDLMAYKLMKASAEQGYGLAQHGLGFMYMEGECAPKNGEEAAKWFRLAGEQGLQGSLTTLAMMYQQGNGVPQDMEEAKRLFKQAGFDDLA